MATILSSFNSLLIIPELIVYPFSPTIKLKIVDGAPTSVTAVETEGRFPETEGVTQYVFTDQQIVWLQKEWTSEETFHHLTVEYVNNQDREQFATNLNNFFDTMK